MFQVFVDSAANLPAVTAKKYDIHVVSFVNLVNGKELVCFDPDLSPEEELSKGKEYYNAMRTGCEIKTGLISTANFADAFRTALEADQDVIYLSLSKNTGRIKGSVAVVGNMLKIKPILRGSEDGYIVSYKNVRGRKAVLNELIRLFCETIEEPEKQIVGIAHADAYEESLYMMEEIQKRVKVREFINTSYDYCTGSHVGPDTIALFYLGKDRSLL